MPDVIVKPDYLFSMDAEHPDLPGSLRSTSTYPFVGRAAELERLRTLMPRAAADGRRVALIAGEPGVGKSRLVREFAAGAATDGALVLYGACDAAVRTPYGPFVEALDQLLRVTDAAELRAALGGGGELIRLLPELPALVGELPEPVAADPDTERHRLHMAVADLLAAVSRSRPILLVIEDCHWADAPTLQLMRHLARAAWSARLLLLTTFRDTEADLPRELSETLADLRRDDDVIRMRLAGLSDAEVSDLVSRAAGAAAGPDPERGELATAIHDLTGGNAFLVCELWRALAETGVVEVAAGRVTLTAPLSRLGTPDSVREVVSQRLARLAPPTSELLELAAVAGPEFELEPIRRAAGLAEPELLVALEQAVGSGMIEELPSQRLACRFTHEIVRRALYDRLSRLRRAELHLRVGEALEDADADSARALADLAHHFGAAAQFGGAERAIDYNLRAARAASDALAFDDAAIRLRTAIGIGIAGEPERAAALLDLGFASHRSGKAMDALESFASVAEIGRETGSSRLLARAAIGYEEACWRPGLASADAVALLEEALAAVDEEDEELRIRLLAGLARALGFHGEADRGAIVRENAVALAREYGDRPGLAKVLVGSYWARGATPLEEILSMLTEARDLATELGDAEGYADAMAWRGATFVALGDLESARAEVGVLREMAERTAQPFMQHVAEHYGSAIALCDGNLAEAEERATRSNEWGRLLTGREASGTYGIQMFGIRREQGRLAELAPAVRILAGDPDRQGPWQPGLIAVLAELGMEREARHELSRLAADGIDGFRESLWLATLTYLTDACAALGDEQIAALLYPEFESFAGTNVMIGHLVACYGSADRYLGMLASTLGEAERAEAHFELALERNRAMGASTWLAHTAYEYGRFLRGRDGRARGRADALLAEASSLAEQLGLAALLGKVGALGAPAPVGALPGGLSPREAQILELVARGLSNREIGAELSISEHTAANHIRSILRKTDCANRTEATSFAHRHGLASA
jgi:DNA-binding CsgD family transcriptional regulator/tetratricopeptide (TPR) repeat protein